MVGARVGEMMGVCVGDVVMLGAGVGAVRVGDMHG